MKKKSILLAGLMLMCTLQIGVNKLFAQNVDLKTAQRLAAYYMSVQSGQKSLSADDLSLVYEIKNVAQDIPALYFFNTNNGGFIIFSGSECMDPVIGYSTEGTLDPQNLPDNMMNFINGHVQTIVAAQNFKAPAFEVYKSAWSDLYNQTLPSYQDNPKAVYTTLKSLWDQDYPYNAMCPTLNGQRCPTGCVATMMAQVIKYWRYPVVGKGSLTYYWENGNQDLSANFGETRYDYDNMPDTIRGNINQTQVNAIATLNYHCGVSVRMMYYPDGSGAYTSQWLERAFRMYFKYPSQGLKYEQRSDHFYNNSGIPNYLDTLWVDSIGNELRNKRPVCYDGNDRSSSGVHAGHAFVAERFNTSNKRVWFNWGWSGSGNGWFNLITSQLTTAGYNFSSGHGALFGLQPPADTLAAREVSIPEVESPAVELSAIYPNPASQQITVPFSINDGNNATLEVFTIDGRLVESRTVYAGQQQAVIDVRSYAHGLYVVRLNGLARKFMVQ